MARAGVMQRQALLSTGQFAQQRKVRVQRSIKSVDDIAKPIELKRASPVVCPPEVNLSNDGLVLEYVYLLAGTDPSGDSAGISSRLQQQLSLGGGQSCLVAAVCATCREDSALSSICTICGSKEVAIPNSRRPIAFEASASDLMANRVRSAAMRGLDAVHRLLLADNPKSNIDFDIHGGDALFLFRYVVQRARCPQIRARAATDFTKVLAKWDNRHGVLRPSKVADRLLVYAESVHAKLFLAPDRMHGLREELRSSLQTFRLHQVLTFVPGQGKPAMLVPGICPNCMRKNKTSLSNCKCGWSLIHSSIDFEAMCFALVWAGLFREINVELKCSDRQCSVEDILELMPLLRPYRSKEIIGESAFKAQCYFITHLLFVMSNWGQFQLDALLFVEEVAFITANINTVIRLGDPEIVGEFVQSLRILGARETDVPVQRGVSYLLAKERSLKGKGAWVKPSRKFFQIYHSIYCAIIGLLEFDLDRNEKMLLDWRQYFVR